LITQFTSCFATDVLAVLSQEHANCIPGVNPVALDSIAWKYYIVFVVVLILYGITVFFAYPETKGYSLEQMAVVFDGDAAEVPYPAETAERSASMVSKGDEKEGVVRVERV
jgi:hypothetical protein